jgi:hypothetical protein
MADPTVASRPRVSTAQADTIPDPRASDDLPTPRAEWNPRLQPHRTDMDYLSPNAQRSSSDKGKGRSLDVEEDPFGYEAYQEPEYLTVRPHAQRNRSGESERPFMASDEEPRRGTYQPHQGDLEMGMDSVGNREGLGVMELENGAAYPPVSEEDAEERRIKDVSPACDRRHCLLIPVQHLAHIAAVDMARRKAARASKQFLPASASSPAGAPVTSTLASGLSRASTLLRNRTRRGNGSSSSNGSATLVAGNEAGKRPTSGFGFWRIPSVDSTVAEEREERRRKGWQEQGADDEADVSSYTFLFLRPGLTASLTDRAQLSTTTFASLVQPPTRHFPPIIDKPL